jgi:hypothetical protein
MLSMLYIDAFRNGSRFFFYNCKPLYSVGLVSSIHEGKDPLGELFVKRKAACPGGMAHGHRIRLRNKQTRVRIPPGYKVFRET